MVKEKALICAHYFDRIGSVHFTGLARKKIPSKLQKFKEACAKTFKTAMICYQV